MKKALLIVAVVLLISTSWSQVSSAQQTPASDEADGTLKLIVAIVASDLAIKPVPKWTFIISGASPAAFSISVATDFDGRASLELPKGTYVADIVECCIKSGEQYTGHVEIEYSVLGSPYIKRFPNLGTGRDEQSTQKTRF